MSGSIHRKRPTVSLSPWPRAASLTCRSRRPSGPTASADRGHVAGAGQRPRGISAAASREGTGYCAVACKLKVTLSPVSNPQLIWVVQKNYSASVRVYDPGYLHVATVDVG